MAQGIHRALCWIFTEAWEFTLKTNMHLLSMTARSSHLHSWYIYTHPPMLLCEIFSLMLLQFFIRQGLPCLIAPPHTLSPKILKKKKWILGGGRRCLKHPASSISSKLPCFTLMAPLIFGTWGKKPWHQSSLQLHPVFVHSLLPAPECIAIVKKGRSEGTATWSQQCYPFPHNV